MKTKILFLHGALGTKNQFHTITPFLSNTFDIYDLNFEGHGDQKTDKDFSIPLFTENVIAFMDRNEIEKINVFGYSMGGYVALNMAIQHPERINKIVTLGTKFNWDIESTTKEVRMLNPEKIEEKVPHFANRLKETHYPLDWKNVVRKTAKMMLDLSKGMRLEAEDFGRINQEVLIGIGSKDNMVTYEESESIANILPKGKVVQLDGFPHPIDKIDAKGLADFIQDSFS